MRDKLSMPNQNIFTDFRGWTSRIKFKPIRKLARLFKHSNFIIGNMVGGILFFILRLIRVLPLPPPYDKSKVRKIIIFRPDMLGDVVIATPAIKILRDNFPDAYIAMVVSEMTKDIVIKNPYLNEVIVVRGIGIINIIKDWHIVKYIRNKKFDLGIVLFSAFSDNLLAFLCGVTYRIGYGDRASQFLLTTSLNMQAAYDRFQHNVDINLNLVEAAGCDLGKREYYISIHDDSEEWADKFFRDNNLVNSKVVMIHPGSRKVYQRWPHQKYLLLADKLINELGVKIILLSGPLDGNLANDIKAKMRNPAVIASGTKLRNIVSLVKRCSLYIGHSTGTTHIANALGIRTIMIIGFSGSLDDARIWGPYGENGIAVMKKAGCCSCLPADCKDWRCIRDVSVEEVFETVKE